MSRRVLVLGLLCCVAAFTGCKKSPTERWKGMPPLTAEELRAVEALTEFDGRVERSSVEPGKPIEELHLRGRRADEGLRVAAPLKTVTMIELTHSDVTDEGLKGLLAFRGIQVLHLGGCANVTGAGMKALGTLEKLSVVTLDRSGVTDEGLKGLAVLTNLTTLGVGETGLGDAGVKEIASVKSLTALGLSSTNVTDVGVRELASLKNLTALELANTKVTDTGLQALTGLAQLKTLRLHNCAGVTDAGVQSFLKALPGCQVER